MDCLFLCACVCVALWSRFCRVVEFVFLVCLRNLSNVAWFRLLVVLVLWPDSLLDDSSFSSVYLLGIVDVVRDFLGLRLGSG